MLFNIKYQNPALLFIFLLGLFSVFAFTEKPSAAEKCRIQSLVDIKKFQIELDSLLNLANHEASATLLIQQFKTVRIQFKRFEYVLEYFDSSNYSFFNGTNAVETEYGYTENMQPEGLQVIESELFSDSINYVLIKDLIQKLQYKTLVFYTYFKDAEIRDEYILTAVRYHLIRIETLNLVAFDSPNLLNNTAEMIASLERIKLILSNFETNVNKPQLHTVLQLITKSSSILKKNNFQTLDRLIFIKQYLQPLNIAYLQFLKADQKLDILSNSTTLKPIDLTKPNIYDAHFIQPKFFAQDKYYKDDSLLVVLGKKLFFDTQLSAANKLSCASCHKPDHAFADQEITAITNTKGIFQKRNTPTLLNASLQSAYMFNMKTTSLEMQINQVVLNHQEFNTNYDTIIARLISDTSYSGYFSKLFGNYGAESISFYTINTAIASFERTLTFLNSPFDKYMRNESSLLSESTKRGFNLFMGKAKCGACHFAPTFNGLNPPYYTTMDAEVLGTLKKYDTLNPVLDEDLGVYEVVQHKSFKHAFKTLTVRNSFLTPPYFHNGSALTLPDMLDFYNRGGGAGMGLDVPNQTLSSEQLHLSRQDMKDLIAFIKSLTDVQ